MIYRYPASDLDRPRNLLATLGSFWSSVYSGRDQVLSYLAATAQVAQQTMLDLMELIQTISRFEVPIFHRDMWYALTLRESQRNTGVTALAAYDGTGHYDAGIRYDVPAVQALYTFPVASDLARAPMITNRFAEPSLVWHEGMDYTLDPAAHTLQFRTDPFTDTRIPTVPVYSNGVQTDRELVLWIFRGEFDWDTVYRQFGYVLGMRLQSSTGYRDLLNAVFDALVQGCSSRSLELALSAMTGIPVVLEPEEVVETVTTDAHNLLICTDQHVYKFHPDDTATVAAGDVVYAGDTLTAGLQIHELNTGSVPTGVQALTLGRGMLLSCFYQDLTFENKEVPLTVITDDPTGFTRLEFPLSGHPADVARFFDELHDRGVAAAQVTLAADNCDGVPTITWPRDPTDDAATDTVYRRATLAHLLDVRANPVGEPAAASLPTTINPLQFLVANVLRHNAFIVRVRASLLGDTAVGLWQSRWLRRLIPPHVAMFLLLDFTLPPEAISSSRIVDSIRTFTGTAPQSDGLYSTQLRDRRCALRRIAGTCS